MCHVDQGPRGHSRLVASATWKNAILFFFSQKKTHNISIQFFTQKCNKKIRTTFAIYHKHNQITQINNYKSKTTIDYVLINVFVTNKTKLHRISTNLKTVPADLELPY